MLNLWQNALVLGQVLCLGLGSWCFLVIRLVLGTALLRKLKAIGWEKSAFLMLSSDKLTQFDVCVQSVGGRHVPPSLPDASHAGQPCTALEWLHLTSKGVLN